MIVNLKPLLALCLSVIAGIVMFPTAIAGFNLPDLGWLAWFYLVPLFYLARHLNFAARFGLSLVVFLASFSGALYWLVAAMVEYGGLSGLAAFGVLSLICLILASFMAFLVALSYPIATMSRSPLFLVQGSLLLVYDLTINFFPLGGFPWLIPAYSQGASLNIFQWLDLTGVFGLSLLIYLVNALIAEAYYFYRHGSKDKCVHRIVILFVLIAVSFSASIYSQHRRNAHDASIDNNFSIALIQGNIAQDLKWEAHLAQQNFKTYLEMTAQARQKGAHLAVWPETAYPYTLDLTRLHQDVIFDREALKIPVLMGSTTQISHGAGFEPTLYNSALLFDAERQMKGVYHKRHLVPFGEYVPFKGPFSFGRFVASIADFTPGLDANFLKIGEAKLGVLICYEDLFPELSRSLVLEGANLLVNLTNDAWYGDSSALYQHLVFSRFRALENRRTLVRVTNTGYSAVIDDRGEILSELKPLTQSLSVKNVYFADQLSFYARYGNWIGWLNLIVICGGIMRFLIRKKFDL